MNNLVPVAFFGWPLLVLVLFGLLPPRRALLAGLIGGWLFLPMGGYDWPGPFDWTKPNVVGISVLLGVMIADNGALLRFRPGWFDLPVLIFCLWPAVSAVANGLTAAGDIATPIIQHVFGYGVPYWLGRTYFQTWADARELALAVFIGGLIYVPLCLYEIRMSPQLHRTVYGFHQHTFAQTKRLGGFRPVVFMQHGLAVAMWMTAASIAGIALWRSRSVRQLWGLRIECWVLALLATTILCKSSGALALLVVGAIVLLGSRVVSPRWALAALIAYIPIYMFARTAGLVKADTIADVAAKAFSEDRVASMRYRLRQEDILTKHAMTRPLSGWGPWGGFRRNEGGIDLIQATDGMWVIAFGKYGLVGLVSLASILLLPPGLLVYRYRHRIRMDVFMGGGVAIAVVLVLFMHDSLMNAMPNPVFILMAGAMATLADSGSRTSVLATIHGSRQVHTQPPRKVKNCAVWSS